MSLWATLSSLQGPLTLGLMIFGPAIVGKILTFIRSQIAPAQGGIPGMPAPPKHRDPISPLAWTLLGLQVVYALLSTVIIPPYDVFMSHGFALLTPTETLRTAILRAANISTTYLPTLHDDGTVAAFSPHPLVDHLLVRLTTLDGRLAYVRWGHAIVSSCTWCARKNDYALAALPHVLAPYVGQAILIGALGWSVVTGPGAEKRADRWRPTFAVVLGALCAAEYAARYWAEIGVRRGEVDAFHLSPLLHTLRIPILALLTATYLLLPVHDSTDTTIPHILSALESAHNTSRLAQLARGAIMRSPVMSRIAVAKWGQRGRVEEEAKKSWEVVEAARSVGIYGPARGEGGLGPDAGDAGVGPLQPEADRLGSRAFLADQWRRVVSRGVTYPDGQTGPGQPEQTQQRQ